MKKLILSAWFGATLFGLQAVTPVTSPLSVSSGELETFTIFSPEMDRDFQIDVYLPDGRNFGDKKYPVVYMHDGQNLFDANSTWNHQAWEMDESVERVGAETGVKPIIVGVYSTGQTRVGDLMPTEPVEGWNRPAIEKDLNALCPGGLKGDKYVDFMAGTLKNAIDSIYPTLPDMKNTSVMGSSMGGLASFYALCRHPEIFGSAACLSTHWSGVPQYDELFATAFAAYLMKNLPVDNQHRIYFDTGDQNLDSTYVPHFERIMKILGQLGMNEDNLKYQLFPGQGHSEDCWKTRVDIPLTFMLGNSAKFD